MRAVTRHLLTAAVVGTAAVGVCVTVDHGLGSAQADTAPVHEAVPATASPSASPVEPHPALRAYEQDRTSRSGERAPIEAGRLQQREAALADVQRKATAQAAVLRKADAERAAREAAERAEQERQAKIREDGYDPETASTPREIGKQIAANLYGWSGSEWTCYDKLIVSESNWRTTADNPTSDAYGIPQALPGSKMASEGSDWRTNPATQIKWGLKYVKDRYGTPCSAWSFKQGHNWY